jgi:uncharacterized protein (TIGR02466 family)
MPRLTISAGVQNPSPDWRKSSMPMQRISPNPCSGICVGRNDSLWVNVLPQGGSHTSHIHTNAVLSGTYYVTAPEGASPIVFEDPRHAMMMAAPPRKTSVYESRVPEAGTLMLWESWLRHEVPMNRAKEDRISVSFNCVIG